MRQICIYSWERTGALGQKKQIIMFIQQNPLNCRWKQVKPINCLIIRWWHTGSYQNTLLFSLWQTMVVVWYGRICYKDDCCFCFKGPVLSKCHICVAWEEKRKVHSPSVFNPLADIFFIAQQRSDLHHPGSAAWGVIPSICPNSVSVTNLSHWVNPFPLITSLLKRPAVKSVRLQHKAHCPKVAS